MADWKGHWTGSQKTWFCDLLYFSLSLETDMSLRLLEPQVASL